MPIHILVMDDDELVCRTASLMLRRLGYGVVLAAHGLEAVEKYKNSMGTDSPVAAAILDLKISGGQGAVEAAAQILALDPEAKLVVASGSANVPEMRNFEEFGFAASMPKPFLASDMGLIIGEILD